MSTKKREISLEGEEEPTFFDEEEQGEAEEGPIVPQEYSRIVPDAVQRSPDEVYEFERILGECVPLLFL